MEDLTNISNIVNESVKNSSLHTTMIACGVFLLYMLINKLYELKKAKAANKPMDTLSNAVHKIAEEFGGLKELLSRNIQNTEIKEDSKIRAAIETSFNSFKVVILEQCVDIIIHNNIDKKADEIKSNITKIITSEYYKIYGILAQYEKNNVIIASKLNPEWIEETFNACFNIIYDGEKELNRIRELANKLNMLSKDYTIITTNKIFNN